MLHKATNCKINFGNMHSVCSNPSPLSNMSVVKQDLFARAMTTTRQQRVWPEKRVEGNESVICVLGGDFNMNMDEVKACMCNRYRLDQHGPDTWQVAESDTRDSRYFLFAASSLEFTPVGIPSAPLTNKERQRCLVVARLELPGQVLEPLPAPRPPPSDVEQDATSHIEQGEVRHGLSLVTIPPASSRSVEAVDWSACNVAHWADLEVDEVDCWCGASHSSNRETTPQQSDDGQSATVNDECAVQRQVEIDDDQAGCCSAAESSREVNFADTTTRTRTTTAEQVVGETNARDWQFAAASSSTRDANPPRQCWAAVASAQAASHGQGEALASSQSEALASSQSDDDEKEDEEPVTTVVPDATGSQVQELLEQVLVWRQDLDLNKDFEGPKGLSADKLASLGAGWPGIVLSKAQRSELQKKHAQFWQCSEMGQQKVHEMTQKGLSNSKWNSDMFMYYRTWCYNMYGLGNAGLEIVNIIIALGRFDDSIIDLIFKAGRVSGSGPQGLWVGRKLPQDQFSVDWVVRSLQMASVACSVESELEQMLRRGMM